MPDLSHTQYFAVYNLLSLAIAAMLASFVYFVLARNEITPRYRGAVTAGAMVVLIAGYHYFRIFNNWVEAYHVNPVSGGYSPTGQPFNAAYRYIDWMLTVPLLMVELIIVLGLPRKETASLIFKLAIASFLMIILGFAGEGDRSTSIVSARGLWGALSTLPFLYILFVLLKEIKASMAKASTQVSILLRNTALLTLFTWGFYPIAYMAPFYHLIPARTEVGLQVGYSLADILAKCGYGLLIHAIAQYRTEEEAGKNPAQGR